MNSKMNKKGAISDSDKILFWIIFVLGTCAVSVLLIIITVPGIIEAQTTITPSLEREIYQSILISSPNCFAYEDPLEKTIKVGYIDANKFTTNTLQECAILENTNEIGFFVELLISGESIRELETRNVLRRIKSSSIISIKPVIVVDGEKKQNGILKFTFY